MGAVEGMARRRGVEKLVVTSYFPWSECLQCIVHCISIVTLLLYALHAVLNDAPHGMLHCYTHLVRPMPASLYSEKEEMLAETVAFPYDVHLHG